MNDRDPRSGLPYPYLEQVRLQYPHEEDQNGQYSPHPYHDSNQVGIAEVYSGGGTFQTGDASGPIYVNSGAFNSGTFNVSANDATLTNPQQHPHQYSTLTNPQQHPHQYSTIMYSSLDPFSVPEVPGSMPQSQPPIYHQNNIPIQQEMQQRSFRQNTQYTYPPMHTPFTNPYFYQNLQQSNVQQPQATPSNSSFTMPEEVRERVAKRPRGRPKGTKNKGPKRPLSAYNVFFKEERARLLKNMSSDVDEEEKLEKVTSETNTKKRKSRKKRVIENLVKKIASRWQELTEEELEPYTRRAKLDAERYKKESEIWKAKEDANNHQNNEQY